MSSVNIVKTPFYEAFQHPSNFVGIILSTVATDGDPSSRPLETSRDPDENGLVDYFEEADEKTVTSWKLKLGEGLVREVIRKKVLAKGERWTGERAILSNFPEHYKLYIHKSGERHDPRRDAYLYGSRHVKVFRSPAEFVLHVKWLMEGSPLKSDGRPDCSCRWCDGTHTQEELTHRIFGWNFNSRDQKGKEKDGKRHHDVKGKDGLKRPKASMPTSIPAKDYTKLNLDTAS
ncbi:hypothetical protein AcW1_009025 [Taiwanofungus camphoratus]|nr:hypothetical protein AcV5_007048 [Antrodia cinnamomea]KAI0949397.1 hypothetical protein AcW1_009025 [Antrodia cinnamomea]